MLGASSPYKYRVSGTALEGLGELLMTLWQLNCVVLCQATALTQYHENGTVFECF